MTNQVQELFLWVRKAKNFYEGVLQQALKEHFIYNMAQNCLLLG